MSELGKRIGQRIRELRTQRPERWTQEELAERAQISVSFLSMIERGERVAHVETLAALANANLQVQIGTCRKPLCEHAALASPLDCRQQESDQNLR